MTSSYTADWSVRPLGDLARVYSGGTPLRSVSAYWNGSIPWVTTAEIDFGIIRSTRQTITDAGLESSAAKIAPRGAVLIAMYGQGKTRGKSAILGIPAAMNQACAAVEVRSDLSATYLLHYLAAHYESIRALSNSGGQENLSGEIVKKIPIAFPGREEQDRIATALDDADSLIVGLERLIAKKQAIKQGLMQQLLTGRTRLAGFERPWNDRRIAEIALITKGTQLGRASMTPGRSVPVWNGGIEPSGFTSHPNVERPVVTVSEGGNSCGWVGRPQGSFWLGGHCYALDPAPDGHSVSFLYHRLKLAEPQIMSLRVGSGLPNIQKKRLSDFVVSVPADRDEAVRIANILDTADAELDTLRTRLAKTRDIKQGMTQELLTGRTRLPVEGAVA